MEKINVLMTMPFPEELINKVAAVSPLVEITQREARKPEDIADIVGNADVMYAGMALPEPVDAPRLRWVQVHFAGVDHLLEHPLYRQTDIAFTTSSGIHSVQMAEYTFGTLLALTHHIPAMLGDQAKAEWTSKRWDRYKPRELYRATLGIVGYGSLGRHIAQIGQAFGMRVVAIKRNVRTVTMDRYEIPGLGDPEAEIPERLYPPEALKSFLSECDYVVLTVPLNRETRHLIDAAALAAMRPDAILINIARGDVVDEQALAKALEEGKLGGAVLDVFSQEPLPANSPLWKLPNVILSPHVSGFSDHYDERATDVFAENLRRFIAGEKLLNLVQRGRDY